MKVIQKRCRDIFRVVGKRTGEMFGLRWLQCFQHCFDRSGFEEATATMREMLFEENTRRYNMNQQIRIGSATATFDDDVEFPAPVSGDLVGAKAMSEQLVQLGLLHYSLLAEGKLLVRGEPLPVVEQGTNMAGMDMDIEYSDEVERMLSQDLSAIQQSQEAVRRKEFVRKDEYGKKCMHIVKETLKLTEDSPQKRKVYIEYLQRHLEKCHLETGTIRPSQRGGEDDNQEESFLFPNSENYTVSRIKRKGR